MDESSRVKVLSAIEHARGCLGDASAMVASAGAKFDEGWEPGLIYRRRIGEKLAHERSSEQYYNELRTTLQEIDRAIVKAQSACDKLMGAALSWPVD